MDFWRDSFMLITILGLLTYVYMKSIYAICIKYIVYGDRLCYKILNVLCDIYMIWILQAAKVFAICSFGKYVYKCIRCMIIIEQKVKLEINHIHFIWIHSVCMCIVFIWYLVYGYYILLYFCTSYIWLWYRKRDCLLNYTFLMYL